MKHTIGETDDPKMVTLKLTAAQVLRLRYIIHEYNISVGGTCHEASAISKAVEMQSEQQISKEDLQKVIVRAEKLLLNTLSKIQ